VSWEEGGFQTNMNILNQNEKEKLLVEKNGGKCGW
jgi:hypothetical protein